MFNDQNQAEYRSIPSQ